MRQANAFSVNFYFHLLSEGCRCDLTAGLELANAFGLVVPPKDFLTKCASRLMLRPVQGLNETGLLVNALSK